MDKPFVEIIYKLANEKRIRLEVSIEVKELLEQSYRQIAELDSVAHMTVADSIKQAKKALGKQLIL